VTTYALAPAPVLRFFDNNGNPAVGGTVNTYAAGSNTPLATYTDSTGNTPNANPIILNFRGEASIWLPVNVAYKFVVADVLGNQLSSTDQIINLSLVSLYGGTDTGVTNAYILNFPSPLAPTTNGQVIYWVPSNSNTGPSTLNVNGGGATPILNPNGSVLGANQLLAGQAVSTIYLNGIWQLYGGSGVGVNVGTFGAETPITSAATTDLGSTPGHNVQILGTTTITSFGNSAQVVAPIYIGRFSGSLTLTNSTSLILPGGNNIQTSNGDAFIAEYMGSGQWRVLVYQYLAATQATSSVKAADTARLSTTTLAADPDLSITLLTGQYSYELFMLFDSVAAGAGFKFQSVGTAVDSRGTSPAVADGLVNAAAYGPKLESFVGGAISYATVTTSADGNGVRYRGSLLVTTPGTFGIQWAQVVSTASNTTLRAGSFLTANLLAQKSGSSGPITHIYTTPGTNTETIPAGYSTLTLEIWGGSGGGGNGHNGGFPTFAGGGGGASGGYSRTVISVSGAGGQTIQYTVGAAGALSGNGTLSQAASGTFTLTTMTANGGAAGGAAAAGVGGTGGAGGAASGGTAVNQTGNAGTAGTAGSPGSIGLGGAGIPGINYGGATGGNGGSITTGVVGGVGVVAFSYN